MLYLYVFRQPRSTENPEEPFFICLIRSTASVLSGIDVKGLGTDPAEENGNSESGSAVSLCICGSEEAVLKLGRCRGLQVELNESSV